MSRTTELVEQAIEAGEITQKQHDRIMDMIHRDGRIDDEEKELLSRLFAAMQSGRLRIIDEVSSGAASPAAEERHLAAAKRLAVQADQEREVARQEAQAQARTLVSGAAAAANEQSTGQPPSTTQETRPASQIPVGPKAYAPGEAPAAPAGSAPASSGDALRVFADKARSRREEGKVFQLHTDRLLDVNLNGRVWLKTGSMVAYYGAIKFTREGIGEFGLTKLLKRAVTGEGTMLTKATGQGNLYLADLGKKISIIELQGHSLIVNGRNLLAFEDSVTWDITYLRQFAAIWAGGLFNIRLTGKGLAAITTFYDPITLRVSPLEPLMTDAKATVAWSGSLAPQFKTDVSMGTLIGRASGETLQMRFEGDGFVVIQPYEESGPGDETAEDTEKKK